MLNPELSPPVVVALLKLDSWRHVPPLAQAEDILYLIEHSAPDTPQMYRHLMDALKLEESTLLALGLLPTWYPVTRLITRVDVVFARKREVVRRIQDYRDHIADSAQKILGMAEAMRFCRRAAA